MKATNVNEIQVVLHEYLGNRKAMNVAEIVYTVMKSEIQHIHNRNKLFINEHVDEALIPTMVSMLKTQVKEILLQYLEKDEVEECLEQLMAESILNGIEITIDIETIRVEGSDSNAYSELLRYTPVSPTESKFLRKLRNAIKAGVKKFDVPVCDPSIDIDGNLQFISECIPAYGYTYNELVKIAEKRGLRLGSKNEYYLFLGTIINRLIAEGWSVEYAFKAICACSEKLGHYINSVYAKDGFELTGSRKIGGKCDLGNTRKVLAYDEEVGGFWIAGGDYHVRSSYYPLAELDRYDYYDTQLYYGVGWFVF